MENLEVSRKKGTESKSIGISEIEKRLDLIINIKGEQGLNKLRDKAKTLATQLNLQTEYEKLNKIISALLSTHPSHILTSPLARARAFGLPYDINRITIFEKLFIDLKNGIFLELKDTRNDLSFKNISFFESYFSNYIEGTEFEIEEALKIIDSGSPMQMRNEDSHDILGTYQLVSNRFEMNRIPMNSIDLIEILLHRHKILLSARAHKNPGSFKDKNNRAGDTQFVDYKLVRGTLEKGYDYYQALDDPFARACFMMFLISEVHPFLDGNGRIARVMMNAELVHRGQSKIIIPTVYRDDYMIALRKLSRQKDTKAYLNMMRRAYLFSATILGNDFSEMKQILTASNSFKSSDDARLKIKGE